jgi:uncharacterized membrane protein
LPAVVLAGTVPDGRRGGRLRRHHRPAREAVLVAAKAGATGALALVGLELAIMRAFVYKIGFKGGSTLDGFLRAFVRLTLVGFAIAVTISAHLLWTYGRFDGTALMPGIAQIVVLALPASLGAASARLIL